MSRERKPVIRAVLYTICAPLSAYMAVDTGAPFMAAQAVALTILSVLYLRRCLEVKGDAP